MVCMDCAGWTAITFMINKKVWGEIFPDNEGIICIKCFEKRLGRSVVIEDFSDYTAAPVNEMLFFAYEMGKRKYKNQPLLFDFKE